MYHRFLRSHFAGSFQNIYMKCDNSITGSRWHFNTMGKYARIKKQSRVYNCNIIQQDLTFYYLIFNTVERLSFRVSFPHYVCNQTWHALHTFQISVSA